MRKLGTIILLTLILVSSLSFTTSTSPAGIKELEMESGGYAPVTLYFHRGEPELDTKFPTNNTTATADFGTKGNENIVTFRTDPLDKDLLVDKNQSFRVAFNFTVIVTQGNPGLDYVKVNLTISVLEDDIECASEKYPSEKVYAVAPPGVANRSFLVDLTLIFADGWDFKFDKDDKIKVRIAPDIEEHDVSGVVPIKLVYDVYMEYDHEDKLGVLSNVHCAPVEIDLDAYDKDNNLKTEFMPNLVAEDCIIKFKGSIKDAFGYEDITEVNIEITGPDNFYCKPKNNITENKTKELLYEWNYSIYSNKFVADENYTAKLIVETVQQHTFYQTTNFTFKACGLEANIDGEATATKTITAGNQTDYTITIRNTGSKDVDVTVKMAMTIFISPSGYHTWNITFADKSNETNTTGSLTHYIFYFKGGETTELTLTAKSLNVSGEVGENWYCSIEITIEFVDTPEIKTLFCKAILAPPYKIQLSWAKPPEDKVEDTYYVLIDIPDTLRINVTNLGSMPDTVNLTLNYTNREVWNITLETEIVSLYSYGDPRGYSQEIKLNLIASSKQGEDDTTLNITARSKGFALGYNETLTRRSRLLNLSRAFGISKFDVYSTIPEPRPIDVEDSKGQASYRCEIETEDEITQTIELSITYIQDEKNISADFDGEATKTINIRKDTTYNVTMTVTCAKGMLAGSYGITVKAANKSFPEHNKTASITITVKSYYALELEWSPEASKEINIVAAPGDAIHRTLKVTNKGNNLTSIDLNLVKGWEYGSLGDRRVELAPDNITLVGVALKVPEGAKDGDKIHVWVTGRIGSIEDTARLIIEVKQSEWERLIDILYDMSHFIILLIAVIVVFVALWLKRRK